MGRTLTNLLTHVVFSTKERAPFISKDLKPRLLPYMGGIIRELGGSTLDIDGARDHVHLLIKLPPAVSMSDAMRALKSNSSSWVRDNFTRQFGWQSGFGAFSVSKSQIDIVSGYIKGQEEHHKRIDFKGEFISLLEKHEIEYDERFIWD
jgi:putative transposase